MRTIKSCLKGFFYNKNYLKRGGRGRRPKGIEPFGLRRGNQTSYPTARQGNSHSGFAPPPPPRFKRINIKYVQAPELQVCRKRRMDT